MAKDKKPIKSTLSLHEDFRTILSEPHKREAAFALRDDIVENLFEIIKKAELVEIAFTNAANQKLIDPRAFNMLREPLIRLHEAIFGKPRD
jgi:hypothetical protein